MAKSSTSCLYYYNRIVNCIDDLLRLNEDVVGFIEIERTD